MKRSARRVPISDAPSPAPNVKRPSAALMFVMFFAAAFIAYFPALTGDFLWDDSGHITNPALQSWAGLARIWFEPGTTQQYYPLLHSAFWFEHRLWGDSTTGYHVINVVQHALAATLFGVLLQRLMVPGAWFAAGLFLLHPVCVESVAWISEQKNTLSLVFYLSAALAYLRFDLGRSPGRYALALFFFVCALLTKTVTASLPAALLVVFWWRRGRLDWRRDIVPLLPWFALGAGCGLYTAHFERVLIGAQGSDFILGAMDRLVLAGRVFWFYLGKLLWPAELIFVYPRWNIDASIWWQWLFPATGLGLAAALIWWSRRSRGPLAVALLFGGALFPVLGFVNVYPFVFSYVADHFQYLASLAIFALAGAGLSRLPPQARTVSAASLAALFAVLTWNQAGTYRSNTVLYETTLRRNPDAWLAHHNLASLLIGRGQPDRALPHLKRTLEIRPDYPEALSNLGDCLTRLGRAHESIAPLERAIQLQPKYAEAHNNLGVAFMALRREEEGRSRFETAVKLKPDYFTARKNLGVALATADRVSEALPHFTRAVELVPQDLESRIQLATAFITLSKPSDAVPHLKAALELDPNSAQAHFRLAVALRSLERLAEATQHYNEAIRLDPRLAR